MLKNIIYSYITQLKNLLSKKLNVLCTFSAGQDSFFLLYCLIHIISNKNNKIKLQHNHHFLQSSNILSFWQCIKVASIFKIPLVINLLEINLANKDFMTENEARKWRYDSFLRNSLFQNEKPSIFIGHTGSDLLETFFWHFLRNSIIDYQLIKKKLLWNIPYYISNFSSVGYKNSSKVKIKLTNKKKKINCLINHNLMLNKAKKSFLKKDLTQLVLITRPLVNLHRQDIFLFRKNLKLPVITDKSNDNNYYYRNRIRNILFPIMRILFNKKTDKNLIKLFL
uniref:tRNA(Ile)-lysidine synthase, plastid n=1 Tax=Helicosporidium sp. subsp. Simulium jonesii TaxID=145475 RepID=TILS_HELSJ|nr:hypothetical protein RF62 [Helicosporidium sp. ex Simulium jonesi]Q2EEX9.1 RecName: Full=tRNA(Ile)-lysidine synthase, plastid; AltName: Full=tRNA(Ile)-2-lysyl-cytidine synthase; AltName: Full=tRNA(Ile)-lysidine synthetase [Helicosporidium sp. ex Simulium jonesi]ABD33964.1 tRNA(Ile)-lysidine synthase [Helicosporidium sp. ex Simulium jonesi]